MENANNQNTGIGGTGELPAAARPNAGVSPAASSGGTSFARPIDGVVASPPTATTASTPAASPAPAQPTATPAFGASPAATSAPAVQPAPSVTSPQSLLQTQPASGPKLVSTAPAVASTPTVVAATPAKKSWWARLRGRGHRVRFITIGVVTFLLLLVLTAFILTRNTGINNSEVVNQDATGRFNTLQLPLDQLVQKGGLTVANSHTLSVNGQLRANNTLVVSPTPQPTNATAGQIYYDQANNQLAYFNGTAFVPMGSQTTVNSLGGASGVLTLGPGLSLVGGAVNNSGVLSVQGQTGAITLTGGTGINVTGTTITNNGVTGLGGQTGDITLGNGLAINNGQLQNSGVISLTPGTPNLTVDNDGNGNLTISSVGGGAATVSSSGGTAGRIAKFTAAQNIEDSLLSEAAGTVTTNGNAAVTGSLSLGSALSVINGGTGATALTANGVLIGNGTSAIGSVTAAGSGLCLMSNAGAPSFQACPGGGGVTTLNGQSGAVSIANAVGAGGVVTINDASTSQKGIAQFNATNFTASSGAINTIQDINTTAAPTFGRVTLTSSQATNPMLLVNNTNAGASGNLLDLQLNSSSRFAVNPAGNLTLTGTVNGQTISSTANFTGTLAVAGAASLNGGASVTGTLTANTITPTGALTVGATTQSFLLQGNSSSTITATSGANTTSVAFQTPTANVTYRLLTAAAGTYDICTTVGNCAGVGGGVTTSGGTTNRIAKFTGSQAIGDSIITDNGSTVTIGGTLAVNTITPSAAMTIGSTGQNLALQGAATTLSATAGGVTNTLTFATPSGGNKTITVPNATGTVAVSATGPIQLDANGNVTCPTCVTSGGGGGGQSAVDSLNGLTGALTLANSSGAGSTITINDASTAQKGIAQFNSTNFTASGGTINTIQDINTTAAPTFGRLTVTSSQATNDMFVVNNTNASGTGSLLKLQLNGANRFTVDPSGNVVANGTITSGAINGQTISSTASFTGTMAVAGLASLNGGASVTGTLTANTITSTAAMTVGNTGQTLALQGAGTTLSSTDSGNTTTLSFQTPTANVTYRLLTAAAGTYDICTTVGNCVGVGGGVTSPGGTAGRIAKFSGTNSIVDSLLSESGSTVTVAGNLNLTSGNQYQINGTQISSAALSNDANLAKLDATQIFTGGANTFRNASDSTSAFRIQNAAGRNILNANTTAGSITLGNITASSGQGVAGTLVLADGTNDNFGLTLNTTTLSADRTISLPNESGTVCLQNSSACGFALSSGSGNYIQNQNGADQTANFRISGTGRANTSLLTPLLDTAAAGTLSIGTATATGITLGQASINTVNGGKFLSADSIFAGTTSVPGGVNNGRITSISGSTSQITGVFRAFASQTVDILQAQDSTGACLWRVTVVGTSGSCDSSTGATSNTTYKSGDTSAAASNSGGLTIRTGHSSTSGDTGTVTITSGNATSGNSGNLSLDVGTASGTAGTIGIGATNSPQVNIGRTSGSNSSVALFGQITAKPNTDIVNAFQVQNAAGRRVLTVDTSGSRTILGNVTSTSGQGIAGTLLFADGTNDNFGLTLNTATLSADRTISLPNEGGTICIRNSASCGFLTGSATDYIQNQNSSDQTANFRVSGTGRANTSFQTPLLEALSGGALNITANAGSTWQTTNGSLSITTTNAQLTIQSGGGSSALNLHSSGGAINLGAGNSATINVGSLSNNARTVNVGVGTGGSQAQTVNVGSQGGSSVTSINGGNTSTGVGAISLQAAASGLITIGTSNDNPITMGNASSTSTITVGQSTASNTINIGNATTAAGNTQTINIATSATSTGKTTTTIGNTNSTSTLTLQGGTGSGAIALTAGSGGSVTTTTTGAGNINLLTASSVVAKTTTNSTSAFQVQNQSNTAVLGVDTSNGRVGIGTGTPSNIMHVSANNSQVTASTAFIEQVGTGDSNLEFKSASTNSNYYVGIDSSNGNMFTINSISAATTSGTSYTLGNTVNNNNWDSNSNIMQASDFTTTTAGTVSSLVVNLRNRASPGDTISAAIYTDSSGAPGSLVVNSNTQAIVLTNPNGDNLQTIAIPTTSLSASTKYWLAFNTSGADEFWHNNTGFAGNFIKYKSQSNTSWPSTFGTPDASDTNQAIAMSAIVTPHTSLTDNFTNAVFMLGQTGDLTVRNSTDSTRGFQVQNAASTTILNVDTENDRVGIGTTAPSYKLDVVDSQSTNYVARIQNTDTSNTADGLLIDLGVANASRGTGNYFVGFSGAGTVAGKIQGGASAVAYTTTGADYAEYFRNNDQPQPQPGEVVVIDDGVQAATKSTGAKQANLLGIVSTSPGFVGNGPLCRVDDEHCDENYAKGNVLVSLTGQVPVKVNNEGGAIEPGDYLTSSSTPGVAMKLNGAGMAIGRALGTPSGGKVTALVGVQYHNPTTAESVQGQTNQQLSNIQSQINAIRTQLESSSFDSLNVTGSANIANLTVQERITAKDLTVTGTATITNLVVTGNLTTPQLTVNGHIVTGGGAPAVAAGSGACGAAVSIEGTDTAGLITMTAGSGCSANGALADVDFKKAFGAAPRVSLTPANATAAELKTYVNSDSISPTGFTVATPPATISSGATYRWYYQVIQ